MKISQLPESLQESIRKRMCGKSHIADILVNESDLEDYKYFITVCKFSPSSGRGWATTGYARMKGGKWSINMNPTKGKNPGRTAKYS